jgi:hypothetical protein
MDSLLHVTAGSAFFAALNLALLAGAGHAAGAFRGLVPLDRLLATLSIAAMQIVAVLTGCGALGLIAPLPVAAASLVCSLALFLGTRRQGSLAWVRELKTDLQGAMADSPHLAWIAAPAAATGIIALAYAASRPPLGFDSLTYHLTLAAHMMRTGDLSLFYFPHFFDLYAYMPANGDLFSVWTMLPFSCDFLLPFVNLPFVAMLALGLYRTARELGTSRAASLAVASALSTPPVFLTVLTESYVDLPLFACFAAALRFALVGARLGSTGTLVLSAGLAGLMIGTKSTGLLPAAIIFLLHALLVLPPARPWPRAAAAIGRHAAWMVAGTLLLGAAFYVRNWLASGNPLYPVPLDLPGLPPFPGQEHLRNSLGHTTLFAYLEHALRTGQWLSALLGETFTPYSAWGLGPVGLAAIATAPLTPILAVLARRAGLDPLRHRALQVLVLLGVFATVAYVFTPYSGKFMVFNVRFLYPAVAMFAVAAAGALTVVGVPGTHLVAAFLLLQVGGFWFSNLPITSRAGLILVAAALALPLLPAAAAALARHRRPDQPPRPRWRRALTTLAIVALVLAGLTALHDHRDRNRYQAWRQADEPFRLVVRHMADCWSALDRALPAGRVAVAAEDSRNAFLFPLFGSHLSRDVLYVNVMSPDRRAAHLWPEGRIRTRPDRATWLAHLDAADPDVLFLFRDAEEDIPVESRWVRDLPERFEPIRIDETCAVYRVLPPEPAPTGAEPPQGPAGMPASPR